MRRARRILQKRRRRAPEEARTEILEAAERVFEDDQPDQVGLKEVAAEAGVSHALITHYFGTYAALIEAVLERKIRALRARMLVELRDVNALERPRDLLGILFAALEDPVHLRLLRWMIASERPSSVVALQEQGFKAICRQIILQVTPNPSDELVDAVEVVLLTGVCAAYGYALMKVPLASALGRVAGTTLDEDVKRTLAAMLERHLHAKLEETLN